MQIFNWETIDCFLYSQKVLIKKHKEKLYIFVCVYMQSCEVKVNLLKKTWYCLY